jgi:hypothetical protein
MLTRPPESDRGLSTEKEKVDIASTPPRRHRIILIAGAAYLLLSFFVWSSVWQDPASTSLCGCGDASMYAWFLAWPAHALLHGLNPLYSNALGYPFGVNLVANTGVTGVGILLAPVTWAFGPVVSLNLALTLAPALSAFAMFVLLRRWTRWATSAFIGGLFYGFSPFMLFTLTKSWLAFGLLVAPPLIVACLDELFLRQRARPVRVGVALGLLVVLQFFLGTVIFLMTVMFVVIGTIVVLAPAVWRHRDGLDQRIRYAAKGLATGAALSLCLLLFPLWLALDGPGHFTGSYLPKVGVEGLKRLEGTKLSHFLLPAPSPPGAIPISRVLGGYQGPSLSYEYFGIGMAVIVVAGLLIWRQDRRLWFFGSIAAISALLSLGVSNTVPLPWNALQNLPLLQNIIPYRFISITYLSVAIMLGLIVDHAYVATMGRRQSNDRRGRAWPWWGRSSLPAGVIGLVVACMALAEPAIYLSQNIPVTAVNTTIPTWFQKVAPHLKGHQVVLALPAPLATSQALAGASTMVWQAVNGMNFSMNLQQESDQGFTTQRELMGAGVIANLSGPSPPSSPIDKDDIESVRHVLSKWKTSLIVIPDQPSLPPYDQINSVTRAAAVMTAATGRLPVRQAQAWVWKHVNRERRAPIADTSVFARCTANRASRGARAVKKATRCLVHSRLPATPS